MYAPLSDDVHVVVPPPSSLWKWASLPPGELWTLHRAVYGLRVAPRKWPIERDASLTGLTWEVNGDTYYLKQCASDTHVWRILKVVDDTEKLHGLRIMYVDDFVRMSEGGKMNDNLERVLSEKWQIFGRSSPQ